MASAPPPPPAWPSAVEDKPEAPAWDPDADRPPTQPTAGGAATPSGSLEVGPVRAHAHRNPFQGVLDCCEDFCSMKWLCRSYICFLFLMTIVLAIIIILIGIYAKSYAGAVAGVVVLSILGPTVLGVLQAVTFCSDDFEDEAGVWCSSAGSTYWMVVVVLFATVHTIVVVTAPNSLRKYHQLDAGKTFTGSIRDPEAFRGDYRFFNFTDAMFFPGTPYSPAQQNTLPQPTNTYHISSCSRYSYKSYCTTPVVPRDFSFTEPITVWAVCSTPCGRTDDCRSLMSGFSGDRYDCFNQWGRTAYGDPIYGYRPLTWAAEFRAAKNEISLTTAPGALYMRITSVEHVDEKKARYKRYGITVEAAVFGIFFGLCALGIILAFVLAD